MDKEEYIFNAYKNEVIIGKNFKREIARKYNLTNDQIRNIFVRINNYQIENFGEILTITKDMFPPYTAEELNKKRINANARKYQRSNRV